MNENPATVPVFETVYRWAGPPLLEIQQATVELPSGLSYVANRLRMQGGTPGVVVIAQRRDRILLVCSTRPAAGERLLELPRGFGETTDGTTGGRDPLIAGAERELLEETGFTSAASTLLGSYVTDSSVYPGLVGVIHCVIDDADSPGERDGEIDAVCWVPASGLAAMVRNGELRDAHTLAALALWFTRDRAETPDGGHRSP